MKTSFLATAKIAQLEKNQYNAQKIYYQGSQGLLHPKDNWSTLWNY